MQTDTAPRSRSKLDRMRPSGYVPPIPTMTPGPLWYTLQRAARTSLPSPRRTRQGVPDLNGPKMNGAGYNGSRTVTCQHWRDPQSVATHIVETTVLGLDGMPETVGAVHCSACGHVMA